MSELERLERLLLQNLEETRQSRRESRELLQKILHGLQEIFGELEPPSSYPASTSASISVK